MGVIRRHAQRGLAEPDVVASKQATTRMAVVAATVTHWLVETGKLGEFEQWLNDEGQLPPLDDKMRTNLAVTLEAIHRAGEPDCELTVPRSWPAPLAGSAEGGGSA